MTIIYFILILGITIFIHELGHFIFAKRAGIYCHEFSLGMGPKIWSFKRKNDETLYSLRLFPIGGYVLMAGEEVEEDTDVPKNRQLMGKTWGQRFITIIAGILFNFLLAITIFFFVSLFNGVPSTRAIIDSVDEDLPAYSAGLQAEDIIIGINDKKITSSDRLMLELQVYSGKTITLKVKRDGNIENITITPEKITNEDKTTSYVYGFHLNSTIYRGFFVSLQYAFLKTGFLIQQMFLVIVYLITGAISLDSLAGPIGIFNIVGETAQTGFINLIFLLGYISINVGFINLLPIPAFDGGRILFLIIEKIKGSPVNQRVENIIHSIGFMLLMLLMVVITFNDIVRIFF